MSEPFLAEIRTVGFNFAPRGRAFCDGQTLPIAQNQSLFSLLGTTYGGDGPTTFALPDCAAARQPTMTPAPTPWGEKKARKLLRSVLVKSTLSLTGVFSKENWGS